MQGTRVASRYAKSLIDLSIEKGLLEKVYADITYILEVCKENRDLVALLKSPIVKPDTKNAIIKEVFKAKLNELTSLYLELVTFKKRDTFITEICEEFINQYKIKKNILTAVVTTANGIDENARKKIIEIVKGSNTSEIVIQEKIDTNIIGGIIIRVGDKQIDQSVLRKLNTLKQAFKENTFINAN